MSADLFRSPPKTFPHETLGAPRDRPQPNTLRMHLTACAAAARRRPAPGDGGQGRGLPDALDAHWWTLSGAPPTAGRGRGLRTGARSLHEATPLQQKLVYYKSLRDYIAAGRN